MNWCYILMSLTVTICVPWSLGHDTNPSVLVSILVRNKAHYLPYFLHYLENLDYPKDRMALWIRGDHNMDESMNIVHQWLHYVKDQYIRVDVEEKLPGLDYPEELGPAHWTEKRMRNVISLREESINTARKEQFDYLFVLDCDNMLLNESVLRDLIAQNRTVVAPMLNAIVLPEYNNFWVTIDEQGEMVASDIHESILDRDKVGCFKVDLVHSTVLINLQDSNTSGLTYEPLISYDWELSDNLVFSYNARLHGIPLYILNSGFYGVMPNSMDYDVTLAQEAEQTTYMVTESISEGKPWQRLSYINTDDHVDSLGFDQIYVINLKRREDRKKTSQLTLKELHINATFVEAVDGRQLSDGYLTEHGIKMLHSYSDGFRERPMKMGEVGCFLSHYNIWQEMIQNNYSQVMVLEDDARYCLYFTNELKARMEEVESLNFSWDLLYLGRKKVKAGYDEYANAAQTLSFPSYSHLTVGYVLSITGARKLVEQKPLSKLMPVDEYLPIMYDQHPRNDWKDYFSPRNLVALSVEPDLIEQIAYVNMPGYISDTENSALLAGQHQSQNKKDEL